MDSEKFDLDIYGDDAPQETGNTSAQAAVNSQDKENASIAAATSIPTKPPVQQGTKRKELPDDRPIDQNASLALVVTDLHWWITEDDVRGWASEAGCEHELKDLSFNEHKVNGKSKGQVYVEMSSLQASTAVKQVVDLMMQDKTGKKFLTTYHHIPGNPYRTLPKDVPGRRDQRGPMGTHNSNTPTAPVFGQNTGVSGHTNFGAFRGRGGFQGNNNRGGFQQNRSFQQPNMPPQSANFQNNMFGGNNPMNPPQMNTFGGFNRGGMMGGMPPRGGMAPRGGRGGMMGGMMNPMMNGMGGMGMGMPMGMNMGMMNPMMGNGSMPMNNPNQFFPGASQSNNNDGNWNPHGNKRPRPE